MDKAKLKSDLSKAVNSNFLESEMRASLDNPGVGNYNAYRSGLNKVGGKMSIETARDKSKTIPTKLPSVGTYNPSPVAYDLFGNKSKIDKNKKSNYLGRE